MAGALRRVRSLRKPSCRLRIVQNNSEKTVATKRHRKRKMKAEFVTFAPLCGYEILLVAAHVSSLHLRARKTEEMSRFIRLRSLRRGKRRLLEFFRKNLCRRQFDAREGCFKGL